MVLIEGVVGMVAQTCHRSKEQIAADMLAAISDGTRKTRIMYGANLSYALTVKYLKRLQDCGLVQHDDEHKIYRLTPEGRYYLEEYSKYKRIEGQVLAQTSIFEEERVILNQMLGKLVTSDVRR